jgi:hypothetical protein
MSGRAREGAGRVNERVYGAGGRLGGVAAEIMTPESQKRQTPEATDHHADRPNREKAERQECFS